MSDGVTSGATDPSWINDGGAIELLKRTIGGAPDRLRAVSTVLEHSDDPDRTLTGLLESERLRVFLRRTVIAAFAYATFVLLLAAAGGALIRSATVSYVEPSVEQMLRADGDFPVARPTTGITALYTGLIAAGVLAGGALLFALPRGAGRVPLRFIPAFRRFGVDLDWHDAVVMLAGLARRSMPFPEATRLVGEAASPAVGERLGRIREEAESGRQPVTLLKESGRVPLLIGGLYRDDAPAEERRSFAETLEESGSLIRSVARARVLRLATQAAAAAAILTAVGVLSYALMLFGPLFDGYSDLAGELQ